MDTYFQYVDSLLLLISVGANILLGYKYINESKRVERAKVVVNKARATIVNPEQRTFYAVKRIADNAKLTGDQKFGYVARLLARRYPNVDEGHRKQLIEAALAMVKAGKQVPDSTGE